MKLLIADDNSLTRRRVEAAAAKWGYEPIAVSDGRAAWNALQSASSPRLAILDWNMPELDGPEICRRLRRSGQEAYTFMILLTNHSDQESLVEGLKAGADDFVRKPFHAAELEQRVRTGQRIIELQDRLLDAQEHLWIQATHDALTGLWNRREILRFLDQQLDRSPRTRFSMGVMLIDVDFFKSINDTFGHLEGDDVLRQVASVIAAELRNDDHVGRYGGEEFLAVLPGADLRASSRIAERVRQRIESTIDHIQQTKWSVSVSIGIACIDGDATRTVAEAIQQCDDALYAAKRSGRNRVCMVTNPVGAVTASGSDGLKFDDGGCRCGPAAIGRPGQRGLIASGEGAH